MIKHIRPEKGIIINTAGVKNLDVRDKRYVQVLGSSAHTYGNALAFIQRYLIDIFPSGLFKTIHVNSKLAHMQMQTLNTDFVKKKKPIIIFRPRIADIDESRFLKGTAFIERQTDLYNTWGATNLQEFFCDPSRDLNLKFQLNRHVMYVDVVCVFSTLMQQINYVQYLQNAIRINRPFTIETCFENFLPQELLTIISGISEVPLYDEDGSTKSFLEYMNCNSRFPITYKLQGSTGTREFYRYYPVNVDTIITDLNWDEGERTGHVMTEYQMSFTVRMEFNATGFYYLFSDKIFDIKLPRCHAEDANIIPVFTDVLMKEDLNLKLGWHLYNSASCKFGVGEESICIGEMFNESIKRTIKYCKENSLPLLEYLDIKVRRDGKFLIPNKDFVFNPDTYVVTIRNANPVQTYRFMVCTNVLGINELVKRVYNLT